MSTISQMVTDPLHVQVEINPEICNSPFAVKEDLVNSLVEAITKPALIFETRQEDKRYYYRSIDWQKTMLVETKKNENSWLAIDCQIDPKPEMIKEIFSKSRQIYEKKK